jgi:purine nucleoside phosphorylase
MEDVQEAEEHIDMLRRAATLIGEKDGRRAIDTAEAYLALWTRKLDEARQRHHNQGQ